MCDYPAAHSMDTEWFAVDADGNIALFDSSEGGAVPEEAGGYDGEAILDLLEKWKQANNATVLHIKTPGNAISNVIQISDVLEVFEIREDKRKLEQARQGYEPDYYLNLFKVLQLIIPNSSPESDWIFQFKDEKTFDGFFEKFHKDANRDNNRIIRFAGSESIYGLHESIISRNRSLIRDMLVSEKVAGAKPVDLLGYCIGTDSHELGLFVYETDDCIPYPYEKLGSPTTPLKLYDLPQQVQNSIRWTRFADIHFSEQQLIQPLEHMKCATWGDEKYWIDTQGQEREGHPFG